MHQIGKAWQETYLHVLVRRFLPLLGHRPRRSTREVLDDGEYDAGYAHGGHGVKEDGPIFTWRR